MGVFLKKFFGKIVVYFFCKYCLQLYLYYNKIEKIFLRTVIMLDLRSIDFLLSEGAESRNMKLAKHFLYSAYGCNEEEALRYIGALKTDIPNVRLCKCKFMLGIVRMFVSGELRYAEVIMNLNKCLKFICSAAHVNEYDNNLNGLSAVELINRFSGVVANDLRADKEDISSQEYSVNNDYKIIKINSFSESEEYGEYVSWCVTYDRGMYNAYTKGGYGVFYFCLRNGFENEEAIKGEGCPLDDYGLSMIAVSVNSDGSCNTITCRWNHDNGGNDNIMGTKELSKLLGVNFYDVFKPLTKEEIDSNQKEMLYEIEEELSSYMGYKSPYEMGCDRKEFDPEYGDEIEKDVYAFLSDSADGVVLIDDSWNLVSEEIFSKISYRQGDIMSVSKDGYGYNFLSVNGDLLCNEWFDQVINDFDKGIGLCRKGKLWNAIRKDGSYVFNDWYNGIEFHGRFKDVSKSYFMLIKNGVFMLSGIDGENFFERWFEKIFRANDDNIFIRFVGDDYYCLYDGNFRIKANYRVKELLGYIGHEYYSIRLDNGNIYYLNNSGDLIDPESLEVIRKNNFSIKEYVEGF